MDDPGTVGAEIRMRLPGLPPRQGKVAAAIMDRKHIGETTTWKEIAGVCVLSDAMVVKRPGLGRFRDFSRGHCNRHRFDIANEIVPQVCRTAMQAPEDTFAILDREPFDRGADDLFRGRQHSAIATQDLTA